MSSKIFLNCPYEEKDKAKKAGAKWDGQAKQWYVPSDLYYELEKFNEWAPNGRLYLNCPYEDKDRAKAKGAKFDGDVKKWYVLPSPKLKEKDFAEWLPQKQKKTTPQKTKKNSTTKKQAAPTPTKAKAKTKIEKTTTTPSKKRKAVPVTQESPAASSSPAKKKKTAATASSKTKAAASSKAKKATSSKSSSSSQPKVPLSLRDLPRVTAKLTIAQLNHELLHRNPSQKGMSGKNKDWFVQQLGVGSIWESSPEAKQRLGANEVPKISEKMTLAQLSHEMLERDPTQKCSSKNKAWFLDKLCPGSLWITGSIENKVQQQPMKKTVAKAVQKTKDVTGKGEKKKATSSAAAPATKPKSISGSTKTSKKETAEKVVKKEATATSAATKPKPNNSGSMTTKTSKKETTGKVKKESTAASSTNVAAARKKAKLNDGSIAATKTTPPTRLVGKKSLKAKAENITDSKKKPDDVTAAAFIERVQAARKAQAAKRDIVAKKIVDLKKSISVATTAAAKKPSKPSNKSSLAAKTKVKKESDSADSQKPDVVESSNMFGKDSKKVVKKETLHRGEKAKIASSTIKETKPVKIKSESVTNTKATTIFCTRCQQEASAESICRVPHSEHLHEHRQSSYGFPDVSHEMSCRACQSIFIQRASNRNTPRWQMPIVEGEEWCYEGSHSSYNLPDDDKRRVYNDFFVIRAGPNMQDEINSLDGNGKVGVLRICSENFPDETEHNDIRLAVRLPNLIELQIENVGMGQIKLNQDLAPNVKKIWMQNATAIEKPNFEIICPELQDFCCNFWGPGDDSWINNMLKAATKLISFDSYKLRVRNLTIASNHLDNIRLHRAECLTDLKVWAPRLTKLNVQAAYQLETIEFLKSHPLQKDLPKNFRFDQELEINDMNASLGPVAEMAIMSHERVRLQNESDDDSSVVDDLEEGWSSYTPALSTTRTIPVVSAGMTIAQLKKECVARDPNIRGLSNKNKDWFLSHLGVGSEIEGSEEWKSKADEKAKSLHVHNSVCHQHPLADAYKLRSSVSGYRSRSETAACDIEHAHLCQRSAVFSCEQCDFDICRACYEVESLESNDKKKKLDEVYRQVRKKKEEAARAYEEQQRRWREKEREREERYRKIEEEKKAQMREKFSNLPKHVCLPSSKHKNESKKLKYTIWTTNERPYARFSPEKEFDSSYDTLKEANQRVEFVFFAENPWGYEYSGDGYDEIYAETDEVDKSKGTRLMSFAPDGGSTWTVSVMPSVAFDIINPHNRNTYNPRRKMKWEERDERKELNEFSKSVRLPSSKHKNKKKKLPYTIWTSCGYGNDGWHSYNEPPRKEFNSSYDTLEEANERVEFVFFFENPWGLDERDDLYADEDEIDKSNGTRYMSCTPDDSETWTVAVVPSVAFDYLND